MLFRSGGTRTASINGGMIALALALKKLRKSGALAEWPLKNLLGAVSAGIVGGRPVLDLDYELDEKADSDLNFVMTAGGKFVEVQGTAEREPFSREEFLKLMNLAKQGINDLLAIQKKVIGKMP